MIRETLVLYEHSATFHPSSVNMQSEEAIISPLSGVQMRRGRRENRCGRRGTGHTHTLRSAREHACACPARGN